jgi:adenylate cyclase class 2
MIIALPGGWCWQDKHQDFYEFRIPEYSELRDSYYLITSLSAISSCCKAKHSLICRNVYIFPINMKNIEIKYRLISSEGLKNFFLQIPGITFKWERQQVDTYYIVSNGRLKLREQAGEKAELIFYVRSDENQPRESYYEIYNSSNPELLKNILKRACGLDTVVKKQRILLMYHNVRIHLDSVQDLGHFLELEAVINKTYSQEESQKNLEKLHTLLEERELIPESLSYVDLVKQKQTS